MKERLIYVLSALLAMTSCSKDMENEVANEDGNKITVTVKAGLPAANTDADTKVEIYRDQWRLDVLWVSEDCFSVFSGPSGTPNQFAMIENTLDRSTASFEGKIVKGKDWYYAFYPETSSTDATNVELDLTGEIMIYGGWLFSKTMYMYSKSEYNDGLTFSFQHLTSFIDVILEFAEETVDGTGETTIPPFEDGSSVTTRSSTLNGSGIKSLTFSGLSRKGTVNLVTGEVTGSDNSMTYTFDGDLLKITDAANKPRTTVELHVLPTKSLTCLTATAVLENDVTYEGKAELIDDCKIEGGKLYTAKIEMKLKTN